MAQEERLKPPRNILLEPDLELEMSGINERGVKPPPIRLPGKTHLAGVLLTSNPWEQRDLDRKLKELNRLQVQKERAHVWAQRRFFMNRIFDNDLSLRFGKLDIEKQLANQRARSTAGTGKHNSRLSQGEGLSRDGLDTGKNSSFSENITELEAADVSYTNRDQETVGSLSRPSLYRSKTELSNNPRNAQTKNTLRKARSKNSLGIFANPLPENQRKFKFRSSTAGVNPSSRTMSKSRNSRSVVTPSANLEDDHEQEDAEDVNKKTTAPAHVEKSKTAPQILLRRATTGIDFHTKDTTTDDVTPTSKRKPRRDVSFKQEASFYKNSQSTGSPVKEYLTNNNEDIERAASSNSHKTVDRSPANDNDVICDEEVIISLTRTLPTALMLKANANLNAVINERKNVMMTESREVSTQDTFNDDRWLKLQATLAPISPTRKSDDTYTTVFT